jgi:hypothetical protein
MQDVVIPEGLIGNPDFNNMDPRQNHSGMTDFFYAVQMLQNSYAIFNERK